MIDFEDPQAFAVRIAVCKRVEAGSEDNVLPRALLVDTREFVLRIAAARDEQGTHRARPQSLVAVEVQREPLYALRAQNPQSYWIIEYERSFEKLVRRPLQSRA